MKKFVHFSKRFIQGRSNVNHMQKYKLLIFSISILLLFFSCVSTITMWALTGHIVAGGTVSWCYNRPPNIVAIQVQRTEHSFPFVTQFNATDPENDSVLFSDNTSFFEINASTGIINFTPTPFMVGNHSILIITMDNATCPAPSSQNFTFQIYNLIPVLTNNIENQSWEENTKLTGLLLRSYFSDPENQSMNFTASNTTHFIIEINNNFSNSYYSRVSFKPQKDWYGNETVIFYANDSFGVTSSKNVTLTVTYVEETCGDATCSSSETCATCSSDCGVCPTPATIIIRKGTTSETTGTAETAVCSSSKSCGDWLPQTCISGTQQRSCTTISSECVVTATTENKYCTCQPNYECSTWGSCSAGTQTRNCIDKHSCGVASSYETKRNCEVSQEQIIAEEKVLQEMKKIKENKKDTSHTAELDTSDATSKNSLLSGNKESLIGKAYLSNKTETYGDISHLIFSDKSVFFLFIICIIFLFILFFIIFFKRRKKKEENKSN